MAFESVQKVTGLLKPARSLEKEFDRSQREGIESSNSYLLLAIALPFLCAVIGRLSRRR
jgi:hypothetical protein